MEDERALRAALKVEASQVEVPDDLLERILRQEPGVRPVRPGFWTRWGPRLEVLAACVAMAGLVGIAAMRGAHPDLAPSANLPAPSANLPAPSANRPAPVVLEHEVLPGTDWPVVEVVTAFLEAARQGNHEQARSHWAPPGDRLRVADLVAEYHAANDRLALHVGAPEYLGQTAGVPVTVSVNVEGATTLSLRAIPIGRSIVSLRWVEGEWKIVSWVAVQDE